MATLSANSGAYTIVGAPGLTIITLPLAVGTYVVTGSAVAFVHGFRVAAGIGSYIHTGVPIDVNRLRAEPSNYAITGTSATLAVLSNKIFANAGSYAITGGLAHLEHAIQSEKGVYTLTGTTATLSRSGSPRLSVNPGSYIVSGSVAGLVSVLTMGVGDYNTTGTAATLKKGKGLVLNPGVYTITPGPVVRLRWTHKFPSLSGTYALAGQSLTLHFSGSSAITVAVEPGTYALTGTSATLRTGKKLTAGVGSYTIAGSNANLLAGLFIIVAGDYTLSGKVAALRKTWILTANVGSYTYAGINALLTKPTHMSLDSGVYTVFGFALPSGADRIFIAEPGIYVVSGSPITLRSTRIIVDPGAYIMSGDTQLIKSSRPKRWRKQIRGSQQFTTETPTTPSWDSQLGSTGV